MPTYKHRQLETAQFMGERIDFVASNERLEERVSNLSHEAYLLEKLVDVTNPDDVFWDVGACLGIHSFVLANHLPDGQVVGFEPMPVNRGVLMDNKSVNDLQNVWISRYALGNESGTAEFAVRESIHAGYGRHSFDTGDYDKLRTLTVDVAPGDELVEQGTLPAPNVVKIDVEGAEPLVLEGLEAVLSSETCRHVFLETHAPNAVQPSHEDYGYSRSDLVSLLEAYGFAVDTLENDYHLYGHKRESGESASRSPALSVAIEQGDIATMAADVLVNSAGTSLRMGTGVAGALRERGGEELNEAAIRKGPVEPGEAVVTDAYDLDADHVVHAASMPHYGDGTSTPETVRQSVREALTTADELGANSIAIPAVGCGLGGLPLVTGVQIIVDELCRIDPEALERATFVAFTADEYGIVSRIADAVTRT